MNTREIRLSVLEMHISAGRRSSCETCPIALSMRAEIRENRARNHFAGPDDFFFDDDTGFWRAPCPQVALDFMAAFDLGNPVEPFEFVAVFERPAKPAPTNQPKGERS